LIGIVTEKKCGLVNPVSVAVLVRYGRSYYDQGLTLMFEEKHSDDARPFFSMFPLFVLARETAGGLQLKGDMTADGPLVSGYFSPLTAQINAAHSEQAGVKGYGPAPAAQIDKRFFYHAERHRLSVGVCAGWAASGRRLILTEKREFYVVQKRVDKYLPRRKDPATFEVNTDAHRWLDSLHERAGLFAWRETVREVLSWDSERLGQIAGRALSLIEVKVCEPFLADEIALFDPESERWHFVPAADFLKK
jgi:hypothetical protein